MAGGRLFSVFFADFGGAAGTAMPGDLLDQLAVARCQARILGHDVPQLDQRPGEFGQRVHPRDGHAHLRAECVHLLGVAAGLAGIAVGRRRAGSPIGSFWRDSAIVVFKKLGGWGPPGISHTAEAARESRPWRQSFCLGRKS